MVSGSAGCLGRGETCGCVVRLCESTNCGLTCYVGLRVVGGFGGVWRWRPGVPCSLWGSNGVGANGAGGGSQLMACLAPCGGDAGGGGGIGLVGG